jgi:hypothetical protein
VVWVKLDDRFAENRKILSVSVSARWLHVEAMCYCGRNETGGLVPKDAALVRGMRENVKALVDAGLWDKATDGWRIHDWDEFNPSAALIAERRTAARDRKRKSREESRRDSRQDPTRARVPSPSPSPSPSPIPEPTQVSVPKGTSPGRAGELAAWFLLAWNDLAPDLPAIRQLGPERLRSLKGLLRAAQGDRQRVEAAITAFGRWEFALSKPCNVDTFLRAKNRDRHLEWGESGPPNGSGNGKAGVSRQAVMDYAKERFGNARDLERR